MTAEPRIGEGPQEDDCRALVLAHNLDQVRRRIAEACVSAGRSPTGVTLIAITKNHPVDDVIRLARLGVTQVGENRDQEAAGKAHEVTAAGVDVDWHFVGRLQRNKCRSVVRYATAVHSVDNVSLAQALDRASARYRQRSLDVCVQVSLDSDPTRGGAILHGGDPRMSLGRVLDTVEESSALRLRGIMAVAPVEQDPAESFDMLATLVERVQKDHPQATWVSAGMSHDFESAIVRGSTHVRVGSALLGKRPPFR